MAFRKFCWKKKWRKLATRDMPCETHLYSGQDATKEWSEHTIVLRIQDRVCFTSQWDDERSHNSRQEDFNTVLRRIFLKKLCRSAAALYSCNNDRSGTRHPSYPFGVHGSNDHRQKIYYVQACWLIKVLKWVMWFRFDHDKQCDTDVYATRQTKMYFEIKALTLVK